METTPSDNSQFSNVSIWKDSFWVVSIGIIYFLSVQFSLLFVVKPEHIAAFWPPNGIYAGALLISRKGLWKYIIALIFLANGLGNLIGGNSWMISIGFAVANTVEGGLIVFILQRWNGHPFTLQKLRALFSLIGAVVISTAIGASLGATNLSLAYGWGLFSNVAKVWFIADVLGSCMMIALILSWKEGISSWKPLNHKRVIEGISLMILAVGITVATFSLTQQDAIRPYNYLIFPVLIWAALRFEVKGVSFVSMVTAFIMAWFTIHGQGPFITDGTNVQDDMIWLQLYLGILLLSSLTLAITVIERKDKEDLLQQQTLVLDTTFQTLPFGVIVCDEKGQFHIFNPAAEKILGVGATSTSPDEWANTYGIFYPDTKTIYPVEELPLMRAIRGEKTDKIELFIRNPNLCQGTFVNAVGAPMKTPDGTITGGVVVFDNITEDKQTEEQVQQLNQQLKEQILELDRSNKELDDFAYIVSHDLKEPLRGIRMQSRFLMEDYEDRLDENGKRKLTRLQTLSQKMTDLLDALLYYSRVGRTELSLQETDLNEVITEIQDRFHEVSQENQVEFRIPQLLPHIICDSIRVSELFHNLISNAVKYNDKAKKWIEIGWQNQEAGPPVFSVRDNGIGIREEQIDSIFRIFKRLHEQDQFGGGTGVGLTFVEKIIQRHGGKIWVESTFGEGTTFYFTLQKGETI